MTDVALLTQSWYYMLGLLAGTVDVTESCRHEHHHAFSRSHTHTYIYTCIQTGVHTSLPCWKDKPLNNVALSAMCASRHCLCLHVYLGESQKPVHILCVSACISSDAGKEQHITWLSLPPKEALFHWKMILAQLRGIFLTVSLTLCWQMEKHPRIPKQGREKWCSALNWNDL